MKRIALLFAVLLAYMGIALAAVNINTATKEELETLEGIGPVKSQAIIDYRTKNGPFKSARRPEEGRWHRRQDAREDEARCLDLGYHAR